jgi:hypothetical protein
MTFAERRISERIPVVKRCMTINHSYLVQTAVYLFICSLLHQKMVLKFLTWDGRRLRDSECGVSERQISKHLSKCHSVHRKCQMDFTWDRNRISAIRFRRLTAQGMVWGSSKYSKTPHIRFMAIRIANYPDWLGPSGKHFLLVILLRLFMA